MCSQAPSQIPSTIKEEKGLEGGRKGGERKGTGFTLDILRTPEDVRYCASYILSISSFLFHGADDMGA